MLKIYGLHTPHFIKVVQAAIELDIQFEVVEVDIAKGAAKSDEHRQRHPFGKVPVINHNGKWLWESNAIMRYMGAIADSPAYPKDNYDRAVVDQWLEYMTLQIGRWVNAVWFEKCIGPKLFGSTPDQQFISDQIDNINGQIKTLDAHLGQHEFLAGKTCTLADIGGYVLTHGFRAAEIGLDEYKNFDRWFNTIAARPSTKAVSKYWM